MPNTNFQTFHQMGQAINKVVRQATGRDNVQNIDMEHITVAQNHYYQDVDVSGPVVSFHAGAAGLPLEKLVVQIEPVQDLHGYDHPWPAGGGKNLFKNNALSVTKNGLVFTVNEDGTVTVSGTATDNTELALSTDAILEVGNYIVNGAPYGASSTTYWINFKQTVNGNSSWRQEYGNGYTVQGGTIQNVGIYVAVGTVCNNLLFKPMIRLASESDATFAPYSNICPITGWTGAQVYVSPTTDAADGQTYSVAFPAEAGTVCGGTLDAVSGELVVDRAYVLLNDPLKWNTYSASTINFSYNSDFSNRKRYADSYSGLMCSYMVVRSSSTQTARWASATSPLFGLKSSDLTIEQIRADAADNKIAICYELDTPITYHLTPTEITTLLGVNNIWSDAGDIEVKFKDLKELY